MKRLIQGVFLGVIFFLFALAPDFSGAFSLDKQKEKLLQGSGFATKEQKQDAIAKVQDLAINIKSAALKKDWGEYCQQLSTYSRYNLALHYKKTEKAETCQDAIKENKPLATLIEQQAQRMQILSIVPSNRGAVLVTVFLGGQKVDFIALREENSWKADLHPPTNMSQYRNVQEAAGQKLRSDEYNDIFRSKSSDSSKEKLYVPAGACLEAFLVKPLRNEISVRLNDQVTSPLAARLGL